MKTALRFFLILVVITGLIYPLIVTSLAQLLFPFQANGSLIIVDSKKIGSELIGQKMNDPKFFHPRPSSIEYNPLPSGGSNLGPTSRTLKEMIDKRIAGADPKAFPADLAYASGSGLDPHITLKAALFQVERIAKERGIDAQELQELIQEHLEGLINRDPFVNVLKLNYELNKRYGRKQ